MEWKGQVLPWPLVHPTGKFHIVPISEELKEIYPHKKTMLLWKNEADTFIVGDPFKETTPNNNSSTSLTQTAIHTTLQELNQYNKNFDNKFEGIALELKGRFKGARKKKKLIKYEGGVQRFSMQEKLQYKQCNIKTKWGVFGLKITIT